MGLRRLTGLLALRIGRQYRLIYRIAENAIEVIDIGPRGGIYR